jgi:hypothetical protein
LLAYLDDLAAGADDTHCVADRPEWVGLAKNREGGHTGEAPDSRASA